MFLATAAAGSIINPTAGVYRVFIHGFETDGPDAQYTLFHWIVPEAATGNLTVSAPANVVAGNTYVVSGSWSGLTAADAEARFPETLRRNLLAKRAHEQWRCHA